MEFFDWNTLATYSGALAAVIAITQFTKNLQFVKKIPTQIWSYLISIVVLVPAYYFTNQLDASSISIIPFNSVVISMAANGGYGIAKKISDTLESTNSTDSDI